MNNEKQIILEMIGRPPIAFYRPLASIAGGATGGLFLSQLLYWNGKGVSGFLKVPSIRRSESAFSSSLFLAFFC